MPRQPFDEEALFHAARRIEDRSARALFIAQAAGDDQALAARVLALLEVHERERESLEIGPTLEQTASGPPTISIDPPAETEGAVIAGRYKLLQRIGEGGMGAVWMADQTEPVKRRVAVKLIRVERGRSPAILSRFEAERQAIALMDHPNIAKLLDAGTTEDGSPYFVMELVKGVPLTEFCDDHKLSVPDRLKLFVQICGAIQHAHQKGIIHRDIKPTNVLVELHDDRPVPKVIDFGLAKALSGQPLTEHTLFTGFGTMAGTPLYMAPEQAKLNAIDVDTRSDIYALGVMLYELLTGSTPIERNQFKKAALDEMLRMIRESDPPTPSKRLSSAESTPSVAANRLIEPAKLGRLVRGDLDWIVMKALAKERERRYETASGFARDVERFLNDEPVTASPPTIAYKLRKFAVRNRVSVTAAGLVVLALVGGIAGTTFGLIQARRSAKAERLAKLDAQAKKVLAEANERKALASAAAEKTANERAQKRLAQIEKGNEIITSIFTDLDIRKIKEGTDPLEAVLAKRLVKAGEQLEGEAIGEPLVVAKLQDRLGRSLLSLGHGRAAVPLFSKAYQTRTRLLGADDLDTFVTMSGLATVYEDAGKLDLAIPLYERVLEGMKAKRGPDDPETLASMNNLALAYQKTGNLPRAIALAEETLNRRKAKLEPDHVDTLSSMANLGVIYFAAHRITEALSLFEQSFKGWKAKLPKDHPSLLLSMNNLAMAYVEAGKADEALPLLEDVLKQRKSKLGAEHPDTLIAINNLGRAYLQAGKPDRAIEHFDEALTLQKLKRGADHPETLITMNNLALTYRDSGRPDRALPLFEAILKARKVKPGPDHPATLATMRNLADAYQAVGNPEKALPLWEAILKYRRVRFGPQHQDTLGAMATIGLLHVEAKAFADAEPLLRECLTLREKAQPDVWSTYNTMSVLGGALSGLKKYAEAEPLLLKGYEGMKAREEKIPKSGGAELRIPEALDRLIEFSRAVNRPDEVKKWQTERAKYPPPKPAETK